MLPIPGRAVLLVVLLRLALPEAPRALAQAPSELSLRAGDALRVVVRDEARLGGEFPVAEEGYVLLPLLGRVQVAGRPFRAVRDELLAAYARELTDAVVQVTPLLRVAVFGEVRQPGLLAVDPTHTLADVLALAGGTTAAARRDRVLLVREGRGMPVPLQPGEAALRASLRSGDRVLVERRGWFRENAGLFVGAVASVAVAAVTSLLIR